MDRLQILKDRVLLSVSDYRTLIKSLDNQFNKNNLTQIKFLIQKEEEILSTLVQRVKVYNAHLKTLKIEAGDINNILIDLNLEINSFREKLKLDKIKLGSEISMVQKRVRPLGKNRDYTAGRIDIIT